MTQNFSKKILELKMKVYTSPDLPMVGHVKNILEQQGILCLIKNQYSSAALGDIPAVECWPELWIVDDNQFAKAKEIVKEILAPQPADRPDWQCPHCQEIIEGQFSECWNCGTERETTPDQK